jgi:hypothetical protein
VLEGEAQQTEGHEMGFDLWDFHKCIPCIGNPVTDSPFSFFFYSKYDNRPDLDSFLLGRPPPVIHYKSFSHFTVL